MVRVASVVLILFVLTPLFVGTIGNVGPVSAPPVTDFRQCANDDPTLGQCHWINSIVQASNSLYFEGTSVMQRFIVTGIGTTTGNVHTLDFSHQASKSTIHAYDFLTSWAQAKAAADTINTGLLPSIGAVMTCAAVNSLTSACNTLVAIVPFMADFPDTIGTPSGTTGIVDNAITAYETAFGNRQIEIFGDQSITAASVTFNSYSCSGGSCFATYTVTWTSTSSEILIRFAGHLSCGTSGSACPGGSGVAYAAGTGSSSISGGPYHFKLSNLDGASIGSQDNQIKGADVIVPPPPPAGGSFTIAKQAIGGDGTFGYTGTGESGGTTTPDITAGFSLITVNGFASESFATSTTTTYSVTVTESSLPSVTPQWDFTNIVCTGTGDTVITLASRQVLIQITSEDSESRVFVNTLRGNINVVKETIPPSSPGSFSFTGDLGPFPLSAGGTKTGSNLVPGTYLVTETNPSPTYVLSSISCDDSASGTPSTGDTGTLTATFNLDAGETVTCTFVNSVPVIPEYPFGVALIMAAFVGIYAVMRRRFPK